MSRWMFDGAAWGEGPPMPWSHILHGDARCDAIPVNDTVRDEWRCMVCGSMVMTNHEAEARRLLPWSKWIEMHKRERTRPAPLKGYCWTWSDDGGGWTGVRIASPDPDAYKVPFPFFGEEPRRPSPLRLVALLGVAFSLGMCV